MVLEAQEQGALLEVAIEALSRRPLIGRRIEVGRDDETVLRPPGPRREHFPRASAPLVQESPLAQHRFAELSAQPGA